MISLFLLLILFVAVVVVVDIFQDLERLFFLLLLVFLDVVIPKMAALSLTFTSSSMRPVSREIFGVVPDPEVAEEDELFLLI